MKYIKLFENSIEEISSYEYTNYFLSSHLRQTKIEFTDYELDKLNKFNYIKVRKDQIDIADSYLRELGYDMACVPSINVIKISDDYYIVRYVEDQKVLLYKIDQLQTLIKFINNSK